MSVQLVSHKIVAQRNLRNVQGMNLGTGREFDSIRNVFINHDIQVKINLTQLDSLSVCLSRIPIPNSISILL
jgi:hypothetical protein